MKRADLIAGIRQFMAGTDQSNSPRLRQFSEAYSALCAELGRELEQCRESIRSGNITEARRQNLSYDPPLTRRVQMLDFPERDAFLRLCSSYGYPVPAPFDAELLRRLNSPAAHSERKLAELMQHWRQQARSGSTVEKIRLLRNIVETVPESSAAEWRRNLAALERQRDAEIATELAKREWNLSELAELEKLHLELRRPDRLTLPPENTSQRMDELLKPLQRQEVAATAKKRADEMQEFYIERNLPELRKSLEAWHTLKSHPLFSAAPEQLQTEHDIENFLADMDRDETRRKQYEMLLAGLTHGIEENMPYFELERLYSQLLLLELPLPEKLTERMTFLQKEAEDQEHRKSVRHCVYSGVAALLLLAVLMGTLFVTMYFRRVNHTCRSYEALLKKGDFRTVLQQHALLAKEAPRIARDSRVKKLAQDARSEELAFQQNETRARELCRRNLAEIEKLLQNHLCESEQIGKFFRELQLLKKYLNKAELDAISRLETRVVKERRHAQQQCIARFETEMGKLFAHLEKIRQSVRSAPELPALTEELEQQKKQYRKLLADTPKAVLEQVERKSKLEWDTRLGELEYMLKQEKDYRSIRARLDRPAGISDFLTALSDARERQPELARLYARAMAPGREVALERMNRAALFLDNNDTAAFLDGRTVFPDEFRDTPLYGDISYCAFRTGGFDIRGFLENIVKNLDLYELIFKDREGRIVVLYSANPPHVIHSMGNREKIRGISLNLQPGSGQKSVPAMLSLQSGDNTFRLRIAQKRLEELSSIGPLTLISGLDLKSGAAEKNAAYTMALRLQAEKITPQNQEAFMRRLLRETSSEKIRNPRLRAALLCQVLTGLSKSAPVYGDVSAPLLPRLETLCRAKPDMLHPLAFDSAENLQTILHESGIGQLLAEKDGIAQFYFEMLSQGFVPLGIINSQGKPHFFGTRQSELLVFSPHGLQLLKSDFSSEKTDSADRQLLWPGQVLWGFSRGLRCREFFSSGKAAHLRRHPVLWPRNLYFRSESL